MLSRNTSFLSLWIGQSLYRLGDALYVLGVVTLLYTQTNSVLCATVFPFVKAVTSLISGIVAPLAMQQIPLRRLVVLSQVSQAFLLLGLIYCLTACPFNVPVVALFVIGLAFLEGWSGPSRSAMIPRIIPDRIWFGQIV